MQQRAHTFVRARARACLQAVKPGKGRTIKCLLEHMAEPDFGSECKEELQERNEAMKSDIRCVQRR